MRCWGWRVGFLGRLSSGLCGRGCSRSCSWGLVGGIGRIAGRVVGGRVVDRDRVVGTGRSCREVDVGLGIDSLGIVGRVVERGSLVIGRVLGCCSHVLGRIAGCCNHVLDMTVGCSLVAGSGRLDRSMEQEHDSRGTHMGCLYLDLVSGLSVWLLGLHMGVVVPACVRPAETGRCRRSKHYLTWCLNN